MIWINPSHIAGGSLNIRVQLQGSPASDPAGIRSMKRLGELDTIAVDPLHWRTGIGTALMSVALRHLAADGYNEAIVWTVEGISEWNCFLRGLWVAPRWRRPG